MKMKTGAAIMQYFNSHKITKSLVDAIVFILGVAIMTTAVFITIPAVVPNGTVASLVSGHSMDPTLHDGQVLFSEIRDINRGDIVVTYMPEEVIDAYPQYDGQSIVKRVIGIPGDIIEIRADHSILVNHETIDEPYLSDEASTHTYESKYTQYNKVVLGDNEYFILGDNRGVSYDSRAFGPIKTDRIVGAFSEKLNQDTAIMVTYLAIAAIALLLAWQVVDSTLNVILYTCVYNIAMAKEKRKND